MKEELLKELEKSDLTKKDPQFRMFLFALKNGFFNSDKTVEYLVSFLESVIAQNMALKEAIIKIHNCSIFPTNTNIKSN